MVKAKPINKLSGDLLSIRRAASVPTQHQFIPALETMEDNLANFGDAWPLGQACLLKNLYVFS